MRPGRAPADVPRPAIAAQPPAAPGPLALTAVCLGYFMVILDTTIVTVALPALRADLGASVAGLQWVVDGYLLTFAALQLSGGLLADRAGARAVFQAGLGLFALSSLGCALAPGIALLVAARLIQGVSAALSVPASLALLRVAYPGPAARARAIGVWGGVAGIGAAAGPVLGGILVTGLSWRAVFVVNVPVGIAAMILTARHVPAAARQPRPADPGAQAVAILALAALTYALITGGQAGLTPAVLAVAALFVLAAAAFVLVERGRAAAMLPLSLFTSKTFSGANAIGLLINLGFYGELFVLNLYLQEVRHYPAVLAGLALLPQMGVTMLGSSLSGRITARAGSPRPAMLAGLCLGAAGLLSLMAAGASTPYWVLVAPMLAAGFGMSLTMPAATTAVVEAAPASRAGLASGVISTSRQAGGVIGIAVLGALAAGSAGLLPGLRAGMAIAGGAFGLAAVLAAVTVSQHPARSG
ncbi:MAG TPA: MFS transporter [Streptosporangiaceae bacterium]|jgi:DHA2 family methylenomycin A resistance protein-like MFS transporter